MEIKNIGLGIILLTFKNQYEMTSSLIRMQEYYESEFDDILHNFFTLEEYIDLVYEKYPEQGFDYYDSVVGCNIPGDFIRDFFDVFHKEYNDLRVKEKYVFDILKPYIMSNKKFYMIANYKEGIDGSNLEVLNHEISHGFYDIFRDYSDVMDLLTVEIRSKYPKFIQAIKNKGYSEHMLDDEIQAFLATSGVFWLLKEFVWDEGVWNMPWLYIIKYRKFFNQTKKKHLNK